MSGLINKERPAMSEPEYKVDWDKGNKENPWTFWAVIKERLGLEKIKIVWIVRVDGRRCTHEFLSEAKYDFKSHDTRRMIYPNLMTKRSWENLPDFTGW